LDEALIEGATEHSRPLEIPYAGRATYYKAWTDPAGGTGADSYTISIGHREPGEGGRYIIDVVRGTKGGHGYDPQQQGPSVRRRHRSERPQPNGGRRPWDDDWPCFWRLARWR
jgi:hypothetical protein